MPPRRFDAKRLVKARKALASTPTQAEVGQAVGATRNAVNDWENERSKPAEDKLPALARFLKVPLDRFAPRFAPPDLADLRADAGIPQKDVGAIIGRRSHMSVSKAERGISRLKPEYEQPLADAYGVSLQELRDAQERSFGRIVPERRTRPDVPQTLADKINYLLGHSYPGEQVPPSDAEIADGINQWAGAPLVSAHHVELLRTGQETNATPPVCEGLSEVFGVSSSFFKSNEAVVRQVVEGLQVMLSHREGDIGRIAARGLGSEGLPEEVLAFVNDYVAGMRERGMPSADGSEQ
ncbi:helix-turn-helix domain-containing protein [Streptomyces sp. TM32]|uniref:helix-turn-helix transcriptional regulator n=1 Tax=Streptomyces sp. TM32 TaxID=1652669 RepID=UPI0010106BD8|nr:helix-turn-helix transcriptional regulator [Streptomyces sp. TM32]RXS68756.1 helix-turn-helix domain-containing protein [Streptomyces sp. TM32]